MQQFAWERRVDVVIISELNRQLPFWYNDTKRDASIWATRFNGLHSSEDTLAEEKGYVGVKIGEAYCVSGYCSPNVNLNIFEEYAERLDISIRAAERRCKGVIISGDFNGKSKAWGGTKTDRRGRMLSEVLDRNHLAPIRVGKGSTFQRGTRRGFPDIMNVSGSLFKKHKRSVVLGKFLRAQW